MFTDTSDFTALEPQIVKMLSVGFAKCSDLTRIEGGLFNDIYRWVVGKENETGHEVAYYLKQYQNSHRSNVFMPPAIDKKIRCSLAFKVHRLFNTINDDLNITTRIHQMEQYDLLVIQGVNHAKPLIDYLASGEILGQPLALLMKGIARLHLTGAKQAFIKDEFYANTVFRDYKLQLQYYDLAAGLEADADLKRAIITLADRYKTQKYTVLHGDLNSRNIIVNAQDKSFGVIDFEQSHIGHPVYDLAYILAEVYMSCLYHGLDADVLVSRLLQAYAKSNATIDVGRIMGEFKKHLGVQILYRLYGPSKASWSFYMSDAERRLQIIEAAKALIF